MSSSGIFTDTIPTAKKKAYSKDFTAKFSAQTGKIKERYDSLGVVYKGTQQSNAALITSADKISSPPVQYFFHSDHLGSSSLITDISGNVVQHLEYIPFGEVFIDERPSAGSWSTPYKFNAKELDEETGLYYYGARYYDPRTSVWISVDPLAKKYPNVSSYVYCNNNPIKYIDPYGLESIESNKVNMKTFDVKKDDIQLKEVTVKANAISTPKSNKVGGIDVKYMGHNYTFSFGGNDFTKYQNPANFYYYMVNKQKYRNEKGGIAAFSDIFISDNEQLEEYFADGLVGIFEMAGGETGPTIPGNTGRLLPNKKYEKYRWLFPPRNSEEKQDFKERNDEIFEMKMLKAVPPMSLNSEDSGRLHQLEKKLENK